MFGASSAVNYETLKSNGNSNVLTEKCRVAEIFLHLIRLADDRSDLRLVLEKWRNDGGTFPNAV